jgi:major protein 2
MAICKCPATALPNIPDFTCAESFGQIQKVSFQRLYKSPGVKNSFTTTAGIGKKASWTPLLSAKDDTKVVVSPYIQAPTAEAGAPRTFGGGNETLGGIEEIIGREPTLFTAVMRRMPQSLIKALKGLQCESDSQNLGVYLFDENGAIGALQDPTKETTHYPIPIHSLFIGDKTLGGFEAPDSNAIQWAFLPNWSDNLVVIAPDDFNPLTDLKNAAG